MRHVYFGGRYAEYTDEELKRIKGTEKKLFKVFEDAGAICRTEDHARTALELTDD